jgi:hypothetical protein
MRKSEVERYFADVFSDPFELYAVLRPSRIQDGETYRIVLTRPLDGRAYWLNLTDKGIVGLWADCGAAGQLGVFDGEHIIPPQHEYAPGDPPPNRLID